MLENYFEELDSENFSRNFCAFDALLLDPRYSTILLDVELEIINQLNKYLRTTDDDDELRDTCCEAIIEAVVYEFTTAHLLPEWCPLNLMAVHFDEKAILLTANENAQPRKF